MCLLGRKCTITWYILHIIVYWVIFANLQLGAKGRICRENSKYALDENFYGHFCPRRKAANFWHLGSPWYIFVIGVMSIVNGGSRDQLDIICRSTSSRCLISPAIWAQLKHYFLQFDLPQYSNCSYGDNVQVNIKPKCLTLLRPLNIKRLDILTYPIIKPQHQVVEENVTEPVLATLCGAAPIPTVDTFGSSARWPALHCNQMPTFKTQANIPRWWSRSGEEGFPCQD